MRRLTPSLRRGLLTGIAVVFLPFWPASGQTLPTGGAYVAGSGSIRTGGAAVTITQSSARGVINWQGFSVGTGGTVQVNNGAGATLNRVTGDSLSQISGQLAATGSVFLINPNGIVVGPGGKVVTGGSFVASTRDVANDQFMAGGTLNFAGTSSGGVSNAGSIVSQGGDVVLIGATAGNTGRIAAANGTAVLAAGNQVVLSAASGPAGVYVVPDATASGDVSNSGRIKAAGAELASAGGNVYALAGNRRGLVQATGAQTVNGQVWLTAPNGTVSVNGAVLAHNADGSGGTIVANGQNVTIRGTARLSASGTRGGTVLVGVSAPGGVNEAQRTTIASGARIEARGRRAGAGGSIETSGKTLALGAATVNAGAGGSWLLDPTDLTIDAAAASAIEGSLNAGTNVTELTTASGASGAGTPSAGEGDITVAAPMSWSSGATLTLTAYTGININAPITIAGAGGLMLATYSGAAQGDGQPEYIPLNFNGGNVSYTGSGGSLTINGSAYTLVSDMATLDADVNANPSGNYALGRSVNAGGTAYAHSPITTLTGTLEGLGNTIGNLMINSSDAYVGLIGSLGGTVRDIGLVGGSVTGAATSTAVGSLVGQGGNVNSFENFVLNSYATVAVSTGIYVGGLVGSSWGFVQNSHATGSVSNGVYVGGLAGQSFGVDGSYATGAVSGGSSFTGGLVGYTEAGITNSYATGSVSGANNVGGLAGAVDGEIQNSYATGSVSGTRWVGGLAGGSGSVSNSYATGTVSGGNSSIVGGLAGFVTGGSVINSYATGVVSAGTGSYAGGLVGEQTFQNDSASPQIINSYARGTVSGGSDSYVGGLIGYGVGGGVYGEPGCSYCGVVVNAFATGLVSAGDNSAVGGLIGNSANLTITNVYAIGMVKGGADSAVGGLVGNSASDTINNAYATGAISGIGGSVVGCLVGASGTAIGTGSTATVISNAYATGTVSGSNSVVGGLVGLNNGAISNAYWDTSTSGTSVGIGHGGSAGITGLSTQAWLTAGPIATGVFDTSNAWVAGFPYPVLRALPYVLITAAGTQTYGASNPNIGITSITDQNGNNVSGQVGTSGLTWLSAANATSNVGSYVLGGMGGTVGADTQLTYTGTLSVTPASLTVDLTGTVSKMFDGTTVATLGPGNYTLSGLVNGDTVSLNDPITGNYATAFPGRGIPVTVGGLALMGAAASNYTLVETMATADIGIILPPTPQQILTLLQQPGVATFTPAGQSLGIFVVGSGESLLARLEQLVVEKQGGHRIIINLPPTASAPPASGSL